MDITGIIKRISDTVAVSGKFRKRDFVITDNSSQYPQHIQFQLTQDKCSLLDKFKEGDEIKVFFNLRGREWTSPKNEVQYFNTLEAWRVQKGHTEDDRSIEEIEKAAKKPDYGDDDLPF